MKEREIYEEAKKIKETGNFLFSKREYKQAIDNYKIVEDKLINVKKFEIVQLLIQV
jgi:hypothetical protein